MEPIPPFREVLARAVSALAIIISILVAATHFLSAVMEGLQWLLQQMGG